MAGSVNKVILVGNLGNDPEVRRLNSGDPVVNLSIATSDTWKDKATGERKERTEWHRIVIFNEHLCRVAEQYLQKGAKVYVEGKLQTRKWTDQSGVEKYSTEIVLERFGGELTILSSLNSGSGRDDQYDEQQRERYGDRSQRQGGSPNDTGQGTRGFGRNPPAQRQAQAQSQGSRYNDLDDDIPF